MAKISRIYEGQEVSLREYGLFKGDWANWDKLFMGDYNPDALGLDTYDRMRLDAQVRGGLAMLRLPIMARGWDILAPEGASGEHVTFIDDVFANMEGSIALAVEELFSALWAGYAVAEQVYEYRESGPLAGKIALKKIKVLNPRTVTFHTDKYGNLRRVVQRVGGKEI